MHVRFVLHVPVAAFKYVSGYYRKQNNTTKIMPFLWPFFFQVAFTPFGFVRIFFIFLAGVRENFDYTREAIPDGRGASSSGKRILVYKRREFKKRQRGALAMTTATARKTSLKNKHPSNCDYLPLSHLVRIL